MSGLKLAALVPYPTGIAPAQRFRIEQWAPELARSGISVDFLPFLKRAEMVRLYQPGARVRKAADLGLALLRRVATVPRFVSYDVILVARAAAIVGPALSEALASRLRPLVFDFDDAIFLEHTTHENRRFGWAKFPGKTATLCRLSTEVVAGNEYLADYARQHNRRVSVIPSSVDVHRFAPGPRRAPGTNVVVGWMGSSTSQQYLEAFGPMLARMAERLSFRLRVVSDRRPRLPHGVPLEWRPWSADREVEELREFDIGIMPMPDDAWARGKCSMKALLYMAVGVPAVCTAAGMNLEVIEDGANGRLVRTDEEWLEVIGTLIDDPLCRAELGAAGRVTVEQRYSTERCAALFAAVIERAAGRGAA